MQNDTSPARSSWTRKSASLRGFSGAIAFTQIAVTYRRSRSDTSKSITFMTSMSIDRNIEIELDRFDPDSS
jgi:hypothetical protein